MASRKAQALIKAARTGDAAARLQLGRLYLSGGEGLAASPQAAFHWLALAGGSIEAAREIAACIPPEAASADPATYARACRRAADSGSAVAHRTLGELLLEGRGVPADPMAAEEAFRLAAEAGDMAAAARLGELLAAQPDNAVEARLWLERAAAAGIAEAWWDLAQLYGQRGFSGRDLARARQCLEAAARLGVPAAQLSLGEQLAARKGELKSILEAGRWLAHAAAAGEGGAETLLATLAGQARSWPEETTRRQDEALEIVAREHPAQAARLRLAARFDLDARETLFLDPQVADQGWCLLADVGKHFTYKPWRLVRVETAAQREALALLRKAFTGEGAVAGDFAGVARARKRALESLLRRLALDPGLFIRDWRAPWAERDQVLRRA